MKHARQERLQHTGSVHHCKQGNHWRVPMREYGKQLLQLRNNSVCNKNEHGKSFVVGDLVWLPFSCCIERKITEALPSMARAIPFRVTKKLSDVAYCIQGTRRKRCRIVVHLDHLKPCHPGVQCSTHDSSSIVLRENTHFGLRPE